MKSGVCLPYIRVKDARASLAYYERCRANGAIVIQVLEDMPWARDFAVKDPDGNVIRFGNRKK